MSRRVVLVFLLSTLASPVLANSHAVVRIDASLANTTSSSVDLVVAVQSTYRPLPDVAVSVASPEGVLTFLMPTVAASVGASPPSRMTFLAGYGDATLGTVTVRVLRGAETIASRDFYLQRTGGVLRLLEFSEFSDLASAALAQRDRIAADTGADAHLAFARTTGLHPAASSHFVSTGTTDSLPGVYAPDWEAQRAWDRVAAQAVFGRPRPLTGECGPNHPSGNNHSITITGNIGYFDSFYNSNWTAIQPGYSTRVVTEIEVTNDCEEIGYITRAYVGSTNGSGVFSIGALTAVAPGAGNPLVGLDVTLTNAGIKSGSTMSIPTLAMQSGLPTGTWSGSSYDIHPVSGTLNSVPQMPFLFRWNEELVSIQNRWTGMPSTYLDFRAAYDSTNNCPGGVCSVAYFSGTCLPGGADVVRLSA
ncbi:MAG: hypothetical protein ABIQ65_04425 [Thermoanaerobaculia bacterium]